MDAHLVHAAKGVSGRLGRIDGRHGARVEGRIQRIDRRSAAQGAPSRFGIGEGRLDRRVRGALSTQFDHMREDARAAMLEQLPRD